MERKNLGYRVSWSCQRGWREPCGLGRLCSEYFLTLTVRVAVDVSKTAKLTVVSSVAEEGEKMLKKGHPSVGRTREVLSRTLRVPRSKSLSCLTHAQCVHYFWDGRDFLKVRVHMSLLFKVNDQKEGKKGQTPHLEVAEVSEWKEMFSVGSQGLFTA